MIASRRGRLRRLPVDEFAARARNGCRIGAHVACEWVSNVLTKILQRGRLAAYLEQSTRYIPYDSPMPDSAGGGYRFYRDE